MRRLMVGSLVLAIAGLVGTALADEKADPTGTWKWSIKANKKTLETTLKLKRDGDKLTGTLKGGRPESQELKIEDGKYKNGEISFKIVRVQRPQNAIFNYKAKITGDMLTGAITIEPSGRSSKWEAKRDKK